MACNKPRTASINVRGFPKVGARSITGQCDGSRCTSSLKMSDWDVNNPYIARVFKDIAGLLEMKGESVFTIRAYQRAARTIDNLPSELDQIVRENGDVKQFPGIGQAIADKITELVTTGHLEYYERLKSQFPEGILDLMHVPGVGPKTTERLWKELGISTVPQLEQAIRDGRLASLPRMGKKSAENILRHIQSAHDG